MMRVGILGYAKHQDKNVLFDLDYSMGPLRFELKSPTPQAGRIPIYPTVPNRIKNLVFRRMALSHR